MTSAAKAERDRVVHILREQLVREPYGSEGAKALQRFYRRLYGGSSGAVELVEQCTEPSATSSATRSSATG